MVRVSEASLDDGIAQSGNRGDLKCRCCVNPAQLALACPDDILPRSLLFVGLDRSAQTGDHQAAHGSLRVGHDYFRKDGACALEQTIKMQAKSTIGRRGDPGQTRNFGQRRQTLAGCRCVNMTTTISHG